MLLDLTPDEIYEYIYKLNQEALKIKENMFDVVIKTEGIFSLNDVAYLTGEDYEILNDRITKHNTALKNQLNGKTTLT